jgi:hypothetical protein
LQHDFIHAKQMPLISNDNKKETKSNRSRRGIAETAARFILNIIMVTQSLTKVNDIYIQVVENEKGHFVPIRPICDALGIDEESQRKRINRDEILSSTAVIMTAVAEDGKEREMVCLPVKFVHGWLFSIDVSRVNEDAKENVLKYKMECYNVLYEHFFGKLEQHKTNLIENAKCKAEIELLEKELADDERVKKLNKLKKEDKQYKRERTISDTGQLNLYKDLFAQK